MTLVDIIQANPRISIILISVVVSLFSILVTKFFTDQVRIKEIKEAQKGKQKLLKEHKGNPQKMMEIQKEIMSQSMELMKQSFKPLLITLIPLLLLFGALRNIYADTTLMNAWIWYYIGAAVISSMILRKIMKVH